MATTVGALSVDLDLNSANFINNMKKAVDGVDKSSKAMASSLDFANKATKAFLAGFTAQKIGETIAKGLEFAASLNEQAQQLGVTSRELQVYRYAASQVGISNEEMDKGLAKLTLRIGQAAGGNAKAASAFSSLGIAVNDTSGNTRSAGAVMEDLADKLSKIEDPAKRAQIEVALFGKTGQQLDNLLSGGSQAISELADAADRLGIVLSQDMINRADEAADKMSAVKQVLEAKIAAVVADNAGAITALADAFVGLVEWAGKAARAYKEFQLQANVRERNMQLNSWFSRNTSADIAKLEGENALDQAKIGMLRAGVDFSSPWKKRPAPGPVDAADGAGSGARGGRGGRGGGQARPGKTLDDELATLERTLDPVKAANVEFEKNVEVLRRAADQGKITAARYSELRDALFMKWQGEGDTALDRAPKALDRLDQSIRIALPDISQLQVELGKVPSVMDEAFADAKVAGMDAFIGSIENLRRGFGSLKDVALNVLDAIQNAILTKLVYGPLMDWAEGKPGGRSTGQGLSSILSSIGTMFGGRKALGGRVTAGRAYLVGEQGPEPFIPDTSGTIIPNAAMGDNTGRGSSASGLQVTIHAPGATAETVAMIRREISNAAPTLIAAAAGQTSRLNSRKRL